MSTASDCSQVAWNTASSGRTISSDRISTAAWVIGVPSTGINAADRSARIICVIGSRSAALSSSPKTTARRYPRIEAPSGPSSRLRSRTVRTRIPRVTSSAVRCAEAVWSPCGRWLCSERSDVRQVPTSRSRIASMSANPSSRTTCGSSPPSATEHSRHNSARSLN